MNYQPKLECRVHYWQVSTDGRSQTCINCGLVVDGLWEKQDKIEGLGGRFLQKNVTMDSFIIRKKEVKVKEVKKNTFMGVGNCPVLELDGVFYMDTAEVKTCLACTVEKCYYDLDKGEMKLMREQLDTLND